MSTIIVAVTLSTIITFYFASRANEKRRRARVVKEIKERWETIDYKDQK